MCQELRIFAPYKTSHSVAQICIMPESEKALPFLKVARKLLQSEVFRLSVDKPKSNTVEMRSLQTEETLNLLFKLGP